MRAGDQRVSDLARPNRDRRRRSVALAGAALRVGEHQDTPPSRRSGLVVGRMSFWEARTAMCEVRGEESQARRRGAVKSLGVSPVLTVALGSNRSTVVSASAHGWWGCPFGTT